MDIERRTSDQDPGGLPFPAKVALGGLAVFGAITLVQWVFFSALQFIRFGLFVVIALALFGWAVSSKGSR